jgi:hypothetical protein
MMKANHMELRVVVPVCKTGLCHSLAINAMDQFYRFSQKTKDLEAVMKTDMHTCSIRLSTLQTRAWRVFTLFASLLLTLALAPGAMAQTITGTITGTVTDATGAIVSGAVVTIRNVDTNATRTIKSSDFGTYTVTQLPPGYYSVKIDKAGFKLFEQSNINLQIDQVQLINAKLEVGSMGETITVTSAPPVIQSEQSSVGMVLDSNDIQSAPLNGRLSLYGMFQMVPGVQNVPVAQDGFPAKGVTMSVGSTRRNSYGSMVQTLDGAVNLEVYLQRVLAEVPSLDALSEFKTITTGAPAESQPQAQVNVVTKSGTNKFHGELLWFNRSKGLNAKNDNITYTHLQAETGDVRAPYERNEFGGNFAGPIVVPHFYNGHDRSFFFAAFEGFDFTNSSLTGSNQPTDKMRAGDFSDYAPGGACYNGTTLSLTNPLTGASLGTQVTSINTVSAKLLTMLYPHATNQSMCPLSGNTNTWENISYTQSARRFSLRLDHKLTDKDQLRGTFLHAFYGPYPASFNDSLQGGNSGIGDHNVDGIFGWTHMFSSSLLLDVPVSYKHLDIYRLPHRLESFGAIVPGLGTIAGDGAPAINISNPSTSSYKTSITGVSDSTGGYPGLEQDGNLNPTLTWVRPRHTIKVGGTFLLHDWYTSSAVTNGGFTFAGGITPYSGDAFADFLLGVPYSASNGQPSGRIPQRFFTFEYGLFAQDDWKVNNKLTINIGARVDKQWFSDDQFGRNSLWIPEQQKLVMFTDSATLPTNVVSAYMSTLQSANAVETSKTAGMSSKAWDYLNEPKPTFAPRLGFAYQVIPKTVIRGSYGLFYNLLAEDYTTAYMQGQVPYSGSASYTNGNTASSSSFTMSNPFATAGSFSATSFGINAEHKIVTPYSTAYNLQVERELPYSIALRVGYVGMHNMKQNDNGSTNSISLNVPAGNLPRIYAHSDGHGGANIGVANSDYNYPVFANGLSGYNYPYYHTVLNSLQAGLRKQYSGGSSVNVEFQWTRILGVEQFLNPTGVTPHDSYGPVGGITPLVLALNYTYALPFGHDRMFLSSSSNLVDKILGGWNFSGVGTFQTGQPFNVTSGQSGTMWNVGAALRPNRVAGQSLYPSHKSKTQWFNPAAFSAPPCYNTIETSSPTGYTCKQVATAGFLAGVPTYVGIGNAGYDMLRGPGWWNMDMNLAKTIKWSDHYNVQLRADTFNTFNHPNLGTPDSKLTDGAVGTITSTSSAPPYESRSVEFGMKFNF